LLPGVDRGDRVLVHCLAGRSRSAAVAIAYLMLTYRIEYDDALQRLRRVRASVQPNPRFEADLRRLGYQGVKQQVETQGLQVQQERTKLSDNE